MNNEVVENVQDAIKSLFAGDSGGHDFEHAIRVYHNALLISESEPECDRFIIALAALLHDADDHKLFCTENNANARQILKESRVSEDIIDKICDVINCVSFSSNKDKVPDSIEGKIVQDADRLDAMGAVGIARTFAYGGEHGRSIEESIQHFYEKLLLLKDRLNTSAAKRIGEERHRFLELYLQEIEKEL